MVLTFITFAPLSSNAGHLSRLKLALPDLAKKNDLTIICLGKRPESRQTINGYKRVTFIHIPLKMSGWRVVNIKSVVNKIAFHVRCNHSDLVVVQMEAWDITVALSNKIRGICKMCVVLHAIPFAGAPVNPTFDFETDVINYTNSGIENYRRNYILSNYKNARAILCTIPLIANNNMVYEYMNKYFSNISIWKFKQTLLAEMTNSNLKPLNLIYDFLYMARMEKGKGIEYMQDVLSIISDKYEQKIKVCILGRADDNVAKNALISIKNFKKKNLVIDFLGWAGTSLKQRVLNSSRVFLYPSHHDTYSVVLNEALLAGLPCVVWNAQFINLNYPKSKAIIRVPMIEKDKFADSALFALKKHRLLHKEALKCARKLRNKVNIAEQDLRIYNSILHDHA